MDTKTKTMCLLPLFMVIAAYIAGAAISFRTSLTMQEQEVVDFLPENLELPPLKKINLKDIARSPIAITVKEIPQFVETQKDRQPQVNELYKLTMIVVGLSDRMVNINGTLLREGDSIGDLIVKQIESDKVLVKALEIDTRGNTKETVKWLRLEEQK